MKLHAALSGMTKTYLRFCGCQQKSGISKSVTSLMSNSWFSVSMFVQTSNLQMNSSLSPSFLSPSNMDLLLQKSAEK